MFGLIETHCNMGNNWIIEVLQETSYDMNPLRSFLEENVAKFLPDQQFTYSNDT